jgi:hypothetical protein
VSITIDRKDNAQQKQLFVQLEFNQKLWITWQRSANTWAFFKFTLLQKYDFFHTNIMIMLIIKPRSKQNHMSKVSNCVYYD